MKRACLPLALLPGLTLACETSAPEAPDAAEPAPCKELLEPPGTSMAVVEFYDPYSGQTRIPFNVWLDGCPLRHDSESVRGGLFTSSASRRARPDLLARSTEVT